MPSVGKMLAGVMNLENPQELMPASHHSEAYNVIWKGEPGNMRPEVPRGNRAIVKVLPAGVNKTIGAIADVQRKRIFYWNYNSNGTHGIYIYNTAAGTVSNFILVGTNTVGDILGHEANEYITSADIIYGSEQSEDILVWIDSLKRPSAVNIQRVLSGGYGTSIERSFIDLATAPPLSPVKCIYIDDATVTVNNVRNSLFRFKTRFVYDDEQKSAWSTISKVPLPFNYDSITNNADGTKNNAIACVFQTGRANVKKIELAVSQSTGTTWTDFDIVKVFDKSTLTIDDNITYRYDFYNNETRLATNAKESVLIQDAIPDKANAMTLLNGSIIGLGGLTEGRDLIAANYSLTGLTRSALNINPTALFYVTQDGEPGFGSGNFRVNIIGSAVTAGTVFTIYFTGGSATFTAATSSATDALSGILTALVAQGFTSVSSSVDTVVASKASTKLLRATVLFPVGSSYTTPVSIPDWSSRYEYVVAYYDEKGKTNGVIKKLNAAVTTAAYSETAGVANTPYVQIQIDHTPPDWAVSYQILRSKNLTKSKVRHWVSDGTFKDSEYGYVSINNLLEYIEDNPTTASSLGYDFSAGDRIRFLRRIVSGATTNVFTNKDFEIVGLVDSPLINGASRTGSYLKIKLPTTDVAFDFGDGIAVTYNTYHYEIYTPNSIATASGVSAYYECGERFSIGDAGLSTRFHQGVSQNQVSGTTPALIQIYDGDRYIVKRSIDAAGRYNMLFQPYFDNDVQGHVVEFQGSPNVSNANFEIVSQAYLDNVDNNRKFFRSIAVDHYIKLTGSVNFTTDDIDEYALYCKVMNASGTLVNTVTLVAKQRVEAGSHVFQFKSPKISIPAGFWAQLFAEKTLFETDIDALASSCVLDVIEPVDAWTVNESFSDVFDSAVSSEGRAVIEDLNAKRAFHPTLFRFSEAYQQGTNVNQTNRFYPENMDEYDLRYGSIQRLISRDRSMRVFQERKCGNVPVYQQIISDAAGGDVLAQSDKLVNNIQYYAGDFGIGNQPTSLASSSFVDYFTDPVKGVICRLSLDGITPLSDLYHAKTWAKQKLTQYLTDTATTGGGYAKILGVFDHKEGEYLCCLQPGNSDNGFVGYTIAFNERFNAFRTFYSYNPYSIVAFEDKLAMWNSVGALYVRDEQAAYNTWFGTAQKATVSVVFADTMKKSFSSLKYYANEGWDVPEITTSLSQTSSLVFATDFETHEGKREASFLRDSSSPDGLINGDKLKGQWIKLKFQSSTASLQNFVYLSDLSLKYLPSHPNR